MTRDTRTPEEAPLGLAEHVHEYVPNGQVRESGVAHSPVSQLNNVYYVKVFSIGLCRCGAVSKVHVANEDRETGLERMRRFGRAR